MTASRSDLYCDITLVPAWSEWTTRLESNSARPATMVGRLPPADVAALRRRLIAAARSYVAELEQLAHRRDISLPSFDDRCTENMDVAQPTPLILTGHQPTVLHPGLIFKYEVTQQIACERQLPAVSVLMDTDQGDATQFAVPVPVGPLGEQTDWRVAGTRAESLSRPASLFLGHRMLPAHELAERSDRLLDDLRGCGAVDAAERADTVMKIYQKLADCPAIQANSIVRRAQGVAANLMELPLSTLCRQPEIQRFLGGIALDGVNFHRTYNRTLDVWREERKLRNPANPFPNLDRQDAMYELPFWSVDLRSSTRRSVWARPTAQGVQLRTQDGPLAELADNDIVLPLHADCLFVPRGALITIVFRLLCSDLFVHGLGGQSYDQYTDTFIQDYFDIDPPPFAVASASRYLFQQPRVLVGRLDELAARQREMVHHAEDYLDSGWFSAAVAQQLVPLLEQKQQFVATLRAHKQAGRSAAHEGRQLQRLQEHIKSLVAADFSERLAPGASLSSAARAAIESRIYPWFFFDWQTS